MAEKMKNILGIYTRVSTQGQADHGFSLEAQKKEGIKKAKQLGMDYKIYTDEGISAKDDDIAGRPALNDLLNACELKEVHAVFCSEQDRLTRSTVAMAYIKHSFTKHNILLYTISAVVDFKDTEQEFMADMMALLAKRENTLKSIRSKRGAREAAKQGKWIGVVLPYGYKLNDERKLIVDEEESHVVKKIYDWSLSGQGTNTIAKNLNTDRKIKTRGFKAYKEGITIVDRYTGRKKKILKETFIFKPGTIYGILTNPIYKGQRRYIKAGVDKKEINSLPKEERWEYFTAPVIIEEELWARVNNNLKLNKHYSSNHNKHSYLLKGLIRCGCCGRNMYGKYKAKSGDNYYMCSSKREVFCGTRSINIPRIENLIWDQIINSDVHFSHLIKNRKGDSDKRRKEEMQELEEQRNHLKYLENEEEELLDLFQTAGLSKKLFTKKNAARLKKHAHVSERIITLESREEQNAYIDKKLNEHISTITVVKRELENLDFDERRAIVKELIHAIEVKYNEKGLCHYIETYYKIGNDTYVCRAVLSSKTRTIHEDYVHHDDLTNGGFEKCIKDIRAERPPVIAQTLKWYGGVNGRDG